MLDAEMEGRAAGDSLMEDKLLQSVQYLDPHQIHHQHCQQTQATTKLKDPTHFIEFVVGQWASTHDDESTNDNGRHTCNEEDAPERPKNNG